MLNEKIQFISASGRSILFNKLPARPAYILKTVDGLGAPDADIMTERSPYQAGASVLGVDVKERVIAATIELIGGGWAEIEAMRREVLRVLSPLNGVGVLKYTTPAGVTYSIPAITQIGPTFPIGRENRSRTSQAGTVTFLCPTPFLRDIFTNEASIVDWSGGFHFPAHHPARFSVRSGGSQKKIVNAGTVPTPVVVTFSGGVTNAKIEKVQTGEYIRVVKTIASDELLIISTEKGNKSVKLLNTGTGELTDAFGYIDLSPGLSFFQLDPGDNFLTYDADANKDGVTVTVVWFNQYMGV